jgi:hypothetical protein
MSAGDAGATGPVDAPASTPARVMSPGTALSRDTAQALAAVVERTARGEKTRRRVMLVTSTALAAFMALFYGGSAPSPTDLPRMVFFIVLVVGLPLPVFLAWGVLHRALLDAAAAHAGVPRAVLLDAVGRMRRTGVGASTALRDALASSMRRSPALPPSSSLPTSSSSLPPAG